MAFPAIQTADTKNGVVTSNSSTWTVTYPTNIAANDLLLLCVATDGDSSATISLTGFSVSGSSAGPVTGVVLYKVASGSESGTASLSIGASEQGAWRFFRISAASWNVSAGIANAFQAIPTTGTSTTPNPLSLDPSAWDVEDTLWISTASVDTSRALTQWPSNMADLRTEDNSGGAGGATLGIAMSNSTVASFDPAAYTFGTTSDDWVAITIAVRPAAAGGATTTRAYAQANAWIKTTDVEGFGQTQADIKAVGRGLAQAQADIKQTYFASAQANAQIVKTTWGLAQAQADIKAIGRGYGQSQADIKAVGNGLGQAQADIKATSRGYAQAQAQIVKTNFGLAQAQADIKATSYGLAQSQADIKAINRGYGQAQADIKTVSRGFGQANAQIVKTAQSYGQAQADVKAVSVAPAQAQADVKAISRGYGQAQAWIKTTATGIGQTNALIRTTARGFGQAQAFVGGVTTPDIHLKLRDRHSTVIQFREPDLHLALSDHGLTLALSDRRFI